MNTLFITDDKLKESILSANNLNNIHDKIGHDIYKIITSKEIIDENKIKELTERMEKETNNKIELVIIDIKKLYEGYNFSRENANHRKEDLLGSLSINPVTKDSQKIIIELDPEIESSISEKSHYINSSDFMGFEIGIKIRNILKKNWIGNL